jgi:predicted metalloprotease
LVVNADGDASIPDGARFFLLRSPTMRWQGRRGSENIEDRRRISPVGMGVGVGGGAVGVVVLLLVMLMGGDPAVVVNQMQNAGPAPEVPMGPAPQDEMSQFVSVVLADTEDVWEQLFRQRGEGYRKPTLVLFRGAVESACGFQQAAVGPFYCPGDQKVYIDLSFYEDMKTQLDAPGDFAQAYVIAHEVGHHVQNLLGISDRVHAMRARMSEEDYNQMSVRLELQADFFAGVWAHHAQRNWQILEPGDIEEALNAASAIGDDRLQRQSRGVVVPESFTHGTSRQRVRWFKQGFQTGDMRAGDTFAIDYEDL